MLMYITVILLNHHVAKLDPHRCIAQPLPSFLIVTLILSLLGSLALCPLPPGYEDELLCANGSCLIAASPPPTFSALLQA